MPSDISRRGFLKLSSAFAALSVTSRASSETLARATGEDRLISASALTDLRQSLSGSLITPGDTGYELMYLPNNLVYRGIKPIGIAICKNEDDIAKSLRWCRKHNVNLITRNGGHSYAGYSTTRGLMINTQALNSITYDKSREEVRIGAGANNG